MSKSYQSPPLPIDDVITSRTAWVMLSQSHQSPYHLLPNVRPLAIPVYSIEKPMHRFKRLNPSYRV
jgi:hypothetical protein